MEEKTRLEERIVSMIITLIVMGTILGFSYGINWILSQDGYQPQCWIKDDQQGNNKKGIASIKQVPIPCSDFILNE